MTKKDSTEPLQTAEIIDFAEARKKIISELPHSDTDTEIDHEDHRLSVSLQSNSKEELNRLHRHETENAEQPYRFHLQFPPLNLTEDDMKNLIKVTAHPHDSVLMPGRPQARAFGCGAVMAPGG